MTRSNSPEEPAVPVTLPPQAETALTAMVSTPGCDFVALARAAGLDPARDFRGADLRGVDFGASDLSGFDFSGADLSGCDLSWAKFGGAIMTGARRSSEQRCLELIGHTSYVSSVTFSPDGSRIVSGSDDRTLRFWDGTTGAALGEPLRGHERGVSSVAFARDGSRIVSGGKDGTLRLWDGATGASLGAPLRGHESPVLCVAFSPDCSCVASGSRGGTLRLWDATTGVALGESMRGHERGVWSVVFSPDGSCIASGGGDGTLRLWDAASGAALGEPMRGHQREVSSVAFSPDGYRIVSAGYDDTLCLWDAAAGTERSEPLHRRRSGGDNVAFSPDGSRIVSGSNDRTLRLWDATTGAALGEPMREHEDRRRHSMKVYSVAFSPDGSRIVSGGGDGKVIVWFLDPPVHQVFVTTRPENEPYKRKLLAKLFAHPEMMKRNVVEAVLDPMTHPRPDDGARDALENSVAALFIVGEKDLAFMQHGELELARRLQRKTGRPRIIPVLVGDTSIPSEISEYHFVRNPLKTAAAFDQLVQSICLAIDNPESALKNARETDGTQAEHDATNTEAAYPTVKTQSRAARKQRIQINRDG